MSLLRNSRAEREFAEKLVMEVQRRPMLYDSTQRAYKDRKKVDLEWAAIAAAMRTSSDVVRKKWQNLRGSYSKSIASRLVVPNGSEIKKPMRYYLEEQMSFLRPHMIHDTGGIQEVGESSGTFIGEASTLSQSPSESQEFHALTIKYDPDSMGDDGATETEGEEEDFYRAPQPKKRHGSSKDSISSPVSSVGLSPAPMGGIERSLIKILESNERRGDTSTDKPPDPDLEFFKGLLPQIKELSHRNKRDFFHQVSNLLYEALNMQDNQISVTCNSM